MRKRFQIELQHEKRIVKNADAKLNRRNCKTMWQKKMSSLSSTDGKGARPTETVPCACGKYIWKG